MNRSHPDPNENSVHMSSNYLNGRVESMSNSDTSYLFDAGKDSGSSVDPLRDTSASVLNVQEGFLPPSMTSDMAISQPRRLTNRNGTLSLSRSGMKVSPGLFPNQLPAYTPSNYNEDAMALHKSSQNECLPAAYSAASADWATWQEQDSGSLANEPENDGEPLYSWNSTAKPGITHPSDYAMWRDCGGMKHKLPNTQPYVDEPVSLDASSISKRPSVPHRNLSYRDDHVGPHFRIQSLQPNHITDSGMAQGNHNHFSTAFPEPGTNDIPMWRRQPYFEGMKRNFYNEERNVAPNVSVNAVDPQSVWANYPSNSTRPLSAYGEQVALYQPDIGESAGLYQQQYNANNYGRTVSDRSQYNFQTSSGSSYIYHLDDPVNYRRLLERNISCDWKVIVEKIVTRNDQQASIFLQQKLKIGTSEQKYLIVGAIVEQAYQLMINRFGNFLVQRCFEHGTPFQIDCIADAIRGNVVSLSLDAFGCHVVQKALDSVKESLKYAFVEELLLCILETVTQRYACHVWQKLFELRWENTPPNIMAALNRELTGCWAEVALGETGSLVVQNIFENCLEDDKRPCIEEVMKNMDAIARGQWGNWVIQHLVENGSEEDSDKMLKNVLQKAEAYSTDQFASKVIEKILKMGRPELIQRYLDVVCEGRSDRPRIPLIDIASDAHGNYLIQYILQHGSVNQKEQVGAQIRKHMVSLRGSKWGSKCAWLVERFKVQNQSSGASPNFSKDNGGSKKNIGNLSRSSSERTNVGGTDIKFP